LIFLLEVFTLIGGGGHQETKLHYSSEYFFTLSPSLLTAISKVLLIQHQNGRLNNSAYYEFGLFKGFSFWFAEQQSRLYDVNMEFYGFDSFEGLPTTQLDSGQKKWWYKGAYSCSEDQVTNFLKSSGSDMTNIKLFKGFFSPKLFQSIQNSNTLKSPSIIVIDSDIYESAVEVLEFIMQLRFDMCYLLLDDIKATDEEGGEKLALSQFLQKHKTVTLEYQFDIGWHGECYLFTKH
jgi:O-methyltransferase